MYSAIGVEQSSVTLPPEGLTLVQQLEDTFSVGLGRHKRYKRHREIVERRRQPRTRRVGSQLRERRAGRSAGVLANNS